MPDSELKLAKYLILMTNIIRALEEREKEGFSHIMEGALKTVLTTQQNIPALK